MSPRLFLAAALLLAATSPLLALTISGTYYEDQQEESCGNISNCTVDFALPSALTGKFLILSRVGCIGVASNPIRFGKLYLSDNGANERRTIPLSVDTQPTGSLFSWSDEVEYKISGGPPRTVHVEMGTGAVTGWSITCSITGTIVNQ